MTVRLALAAAVAVAALALPAGALAKGPVAATVSGPGLDGAVPVRGNGEGGTGTPLGRLVESAGFFAIAFGQEPDPMLPARPAGDLGPRYTITYKLPGPNGTSDRIVEDVYPYAEPSAATHTQGGQRFYGSMQTRGGWSVAADDLKPLLVSLGIPATRAEAEGGAEDGFGLRWIAVALGAAALVVLVAGAAILVGRRRRPLPA